MVTILIRTVEQEVAQREQETALASNFLPQANNRKSPIHTVNWARIQSLLTNYK
jgi:hypothetical protein